ncbi:MAG TPA: tripartite tricarboxylate transporter substrate binding protein [Burkholderiales bacterium]|nr:tripartite tricarboxylate transporter substrate binding protein [Burkholderiales bacterium]
MRWLCLVFLVLSAQAAAQGAKPLRIIVPFPPGGTADALTRLTAERLPPLIGEPVLVENRAGAGGNVGAELVFRAEPDGLTLLSTPPNIITINQLLYRLDFDPAKFVPVSLIASYPNVLVGSAKLPAQTLDELIAYARANPGKLSIASQGNGTSSHLTAELFKEMAGVDLLHVPYKGTAPALADLLGAQVDVMFDNLITMMPQVRSGKLKLLGVGSEKRVAAFPQVPAISERLPGFHSETWMGIVAPPGTPAALAERLAAAIHRVVQQPDVRQRLVGFQAEPLGSTPEEMAQVVRQDTQRWTDVIRAAHIKLD